MQRMVADTDLETFVVLHTHGITLVISQISDFGIVHQSWCSVVLFPFQEYLFAVHLGWCEFLVIVHQELYVIDELVVAYTVCIACTLRDRTQHAHKVRFIISSFSEQLRCYILIQPLSCCTGRHNLFL